VVTAATYLRTVCQQDGHLVSFTEVEGIPELNDGKPWRIKNVKVTNICIYLVTSYCALTYAHHAAGHLT
jgi:Ubiquitin-activating enzyme E1 FCCH domain